MTDSNLKLSGYEIENPIAALIDELAEIVSPARVAGRDIETRNRLFKLAENALTELEMWGEAVGHISWLASTHGEADRDTIRFLGITSQMQGRFLTINRSVDSLRWNTVHNYNRRTGDVTFINFE